MADRTVRAIFEARVDGAKRDLKSFSKSVSGAGKDVDTLTKDLKTLDGQKVKPDVDVEIDAAKKRLSDLTGELSDLKSMEASPEVDLEIDRVKGQIKDVRTDIKDLTSQKAEVKLDVAAKDARKRIEDITQELGELRTMEVTPEVSADIKEAQKRLRGAKSELRDLNGAKATLDVDADTSAATSALDEVGDAGEEAGDEAGGGIASGILDALGSIPIAGAVIGVGVALAGGIILGIKDGLQVEAGRDFFSAQTGLDEATSARFGRAAGEAYANAYGDSVESNLDTAKSALQAGLIDQDATDAEIENVIAKLTGIQDLFDYDIAMSVQGVGNLMKTGLVQDADEAFDLIVAASQKLPSDDLIETMNEYANQFSTLGITAEQAFGLIVQGADAGARDTDKVADSLKELGIRVREGTDPAIKALDTLGLSADNITSAFQEGGPKAQDAIGLVFDALRDLEDKGGNTQEVIAALFGGPGEDLGAALYALDIDGVSEALGGVNGAAGAADRALETMADNTATAMEEAKRNVEVAMDGVKGALAEAFSDEIGGAAEWVASNRAPLMQFFIDVINGVLDMAESFAEFGATALESIGAIAGNLADLASLIPGLGEMADGFREIESGAKSGAEAIRTEVPAALDETRDKVNEWAAPELLKARIHDATAVMSADMDSFSAKVDASGGTVTINGNKVNAEQALDFLVANINGEDGTVTINGTRVPAEQALDVLMGHVNSSSGDVTIGGYDGPARGEVARLMGYVGSRSSSIGVGARTGGAERDVNYTARNRNSSITAGASTYAAERNLNYAARNRTSIISVIAVGDSSGVIGRYSGSHEGGWLPGLNDGGWVPGSDPGYDNVLWPLNSGGRTMQQPLAGGEFVVNSGDAAFWSGALSWMNSGGRPGAAPVSSGDVIARLHPADVRAIVAGVREGAYSGTSLQRRNEYTQAASTPRGRAR